MIRITLYRSRHPLDIAQIRDAFAYTNNMVIRFTTIAIHDGDESLENAKEVIRNHECVEENKANVLVINSFKSSDNHAKLNEYLESYKIEYPDNYRVDLNHRITAFKIDECWIIITNILTNTVVYKIAAAINIDGLCPNPDLLATASAERIANDNKKRLRKELNEEQKARVNEYISNFTTLVRDEPLIQLQKEIDQHRQTVREYEKYITDYLTIIKEKEDKIRLLLVKTEEEENENIRRVLTNMIDVIKHVSVNTAEGSLSVVFETYLTFWNDTDFENIKSTTRNNWYNRMAQWEKDLFIDIFEKKDIKLKLISGLKITNGALAYTVNNINEYYPNPHHKHYNCWGDYSRPIREAWQDEDYVRLLTTALLAIQGINILDTPVMEAMAGDLENNFYRRDMLELKNGEIISPCTYKIRKELNDGIQN